MVALIYFVMACADGGSGGRSARSSVGRSPAAPAAAAAPQAAHFSRRSSEDSTTEDPTTKEIKVIGLIVSFQNKGDFYTFFVAPRRCVIIIFLLEFPPGGSGWIISVEDYADNSFAPLGSSDPS